jgi:hypothetical protein
MGKISCAYIPNTLAHALAFNTAVALPKIVRDASNTQAQMGECSLHTHELTGSIPTTPIRRISLQT